MQKIYEERYSQTKEFRRYIYARQSLRWMIARGILPKDRDVKILDVGCGTGLLYYTLKKIGYKNVAGCDREKFFPEVIQGDIEKGLKVKEKSFDVLIARDVIEHMRDPDAFFKETYRLLKDGGRIIILTPATEKLYVGEFYDGYDHHTPFTKISLMEGLRLFKFKHIFGTYHRPIPYIWKYTLRAFDFIYSLKRCYVLAWADK